MSVLVQYCVLVETVGRGSEPWHFPSCSMTCKAEPAGFVLLLGLGRASRGCGSRKTAEGVARLRPAGVDGLCFGCDARVQHLICIFHCKGDLVSEISPFICKITVFFLLQAMVGV